MRTIERQLFDVVAISWLTSVSKPEIYRAIEKGRLVAPVIEGRRRATRASIEEWLHVKLPDAARVA
jgi:predicted DNA-binding transcriptional regulator AlpA